MLIANQYGWVILNPNEVILRWDGSREPTGITVAYKGAVPPEDLVVSHFGDGIVTWRIPVLFTTSADFNVWVRGPINAPKPNVYALEGIVETDWSVATFTMNWKIVTAHIDVPFEQGEPICTLVPLRKGDLEAFTPKRVPIAQNQLLADEHELWKRARAKFNSEDTGESWQKDYMRGRIGGTAGARHQTKLRLRGFTAR